MNRTSIGKEKSGIIDGNNRARFPIDVVFGLKEIDKRVPDFVRRPLHFRHRLLRHADDCCFRRISEKRNPNRRRKRRRVDESSRHRSSRGASRKTSTQSPPHPRSTPILYFALVLPFHFLE